MNGFIIYHLTYQRLGYATNGRLAVPWHSGRTSVPWSQKNPTTSSKAFMEALPFYPSYSLFILPQINYSLRLFRGWRRFFQFYRLRNALKKPEIEILQ